CGAKRFPQHLRRGSMGLLARQGGTMTVFAIHVADSKDSAGTAFAQTNPTPHSLLIDPGGFLITPRNNTPAIPLHNSGAWTVTQNGWVLSTNGDAIDLDGSSTISKITNSADGEISGKFGIVSLSSLTLTNAGLLQGTGGTAVVLAGTSNVVNNSGEIDG